MAEIFSYLSLLYTQCSQLISIYLSLFSEAILFSPKICLHMLQEYCLFYPDNGKQELINKKLL